MPLELLLAELAQQIGQRDFHRTDDSALVAQGRSLRQIERTLDADVRRRQDRADRTWIDPPVRVPADVLVDRSMVHGRTTTEAAEPVSATKKLPPEMPMSAVR